MLEIVYLDTAQPSLNWFVEYYENVFPEGANNALKHFDAMEQLLSSRPLAGRRIVGTKFRLMPIPRTPFSVIYCVSNTRVEVARIHDNRAGNHPDFA